MRPLPMLLLLSSAALASTSVLAARQTFIGWHESGEVHYIASDNAGKQTLQVCRSQPDDLPTAWPPAVAVGPGVLCADLTEQAAGAAPLQFARHETRGTKPTKASGYGLKAVLNVDGTRHSLVVSDPSDPKKVVVTLPPIDSAVPLKIVDTSWRPDQAAVAITLDAVKPVKGEAAVGSVVVVDVKALLVGGAAGRKVAMAREKEAQALIKKRDWSAAGRALDDAIAADPGYPQVRLLRAAAEAQGGVGRTAMIENLAWLKASADPLAKKLLEQARADRAFDAWVGESEVRELLGLPAVSTMSLADRLLERSARWTLQGSTCKSPFVTLAFQKGNDKGGKGVIEIATACKGKKAATKQPFAWTKNDAGGFDLVTKPHADAKLAGKSSLQLDANAQQLKLQPEGDIEALGNFEPGAAQLDDAIL